MFLVCWSIFAGKRKRNLDINCFTPFTDFSAKVRRRQRYVTICNYVISAEKRARAYFVCIRMLKRLSSPDSEMICGFSRPPRVAQCDEAVSIRGSFHSESKKALSHSTPSLVSVGTSESLDSTGERPGLDARVARGAVVPRRPENRPCSLVTAQSSVETRPIRCSQPLRQASKGGKRRGGRRGACTPREHRPSSFTSRPGRPTTCDLRYLTTPSPKQSAKRTRSITSTTSITPITSITSRADD